MNPSSNTDRSVVLFHDTTHNTFSIKDRSAYNKVFDPSPVAVIGSKQPLIAAIKYIQRRYGKNSRPRMLGWTQ